MDKHYLTPAILSAFSNHLRCQEKSTATIEKYLRDVRNFQTFTAGQTVTKELTLAYKQSLQERGYAIRSINSMLASLNSMLSFLGWTDCQVKNLRCQRQTYCAEDRELTRAEYFRLLDASRSNEKLSLLLQTICGTGIRVSELKFFTVENVRRSEITVHCKSKVRTILIPGKLKKMLLKFAARNNIRTGCIFLNSRQQPMDRSVIWAQMKKLCAAAGVKPTKVFPHNLRKLFARTFYNIEKDIAKLADILGHSSIETTRIYIMTTGSEHRKKIEQLKLVL